MVHWSIIPGLTEYRQTVSTMEEYVNQIIVGKAEDKILLVEHKEVYTAGTSAKAEELLNNNEAPVVYSNRGGKFTYHGPGQRVIYPLLDLKSSRYKQDLHWYIQKLHQWLINTIGCFDIEAYRVPKQVGLWVKHGQQEAKIAFFGLKIRKWVTFHGCAVNLSPDLEKFNNIIPCGLENCLITSFGDLGKNISMQDFDIKLQQNFYNLFY